MIFHRLIRLLRAASAVLDSLQVTYVLAGCDNQHDISWCACRYPLIIEDCIEEWAETIEGVEVPVDFSQPNPNGMEFDNL